MKNYAQAILLFTGYPLEPIVALQIKKSLQSQPYTNLPQTSRLEMAQKKKRAANRFTNN